jgi:hypothetical protein
MKVVSKALLLGLIVAAGLSSQLASAVTVSAIGSFNDQSATSAYFFNRTYNQDDATTPAQNLPSNLNSTTDSVAYFGWGIDPLRSLFTQEIIQSHFWFNGVGSVDGGAAASASLGTAFSLGSFTYTNERTVLSGGIVDIDFQMDLTLDGISLLPIEYQLQINNTVNGGTNPFDTAQIISGPDNIAFSLNGSQYLLTFNGFSRDGGLTFETVANLAERDQTSAQIYATITSVVPVPAAIWLMGSGMLALFGFARIKR